MNFTIIDKEEFIALFKFGEIPVQKKRTILTQDEVDVSNQILSILKQLPFFEYDEEVLILELENDFNDEYLRINQIKALIPLSKRAKLSFERNFDSNLIFQKPRFQNILDKYYQHINLIHHKKGAKALTEIFGCSNNFTDLISDEVFIEAYTRKENGEKSHSFVGDFLTHLLVYERYDFFPKTDLGFLYDLGTILANSKGKESFKGSSFHAFLESNKDQFNRLKLNEIFKIIESEKDLEGLRVALTHENGIKWYIAGTLYLKFKEACKNTDSIFDTPIGKSIGKPKQSHPYNDELDLSIYVLGLFFGFQKFNKDYYFNSNLSIYNLKALKEANETRSITFKDSESLIQNELNTNKNDPQKLDLKENSEKELYERDVKEGDLRKDVQLQDKDHDQELETKNKKILVEDGSNNSKSNKEDEKETAIEDELNDHQQTRVEEVSDTEEVIDEGLMKVDSDSSIVSEKEYDEKTAISSKADTNPKFKHEDKIRKLMEIFDHTGKSIIRIRDLKEELGYTKNGPINSIIEGDPEKRFELVKDGSADAVRKSQGDLFS